MTGAPLDPDLAALAADLGVEGAFWDVQGRRRVARPEAVVAVVRAAGLDVAGPGGAARARAELARARVERGLDPVVVAWDGQPAAARLWVPAGQAGTAAVELALEGGGTRRWDADLGAAPPLDEVEVDGRRWRAVAVHLPGDLPVGRHQLHVEAGGGRAAATVLAAPRRAPSPPPRWRTWGVLAPLHAVGHADGRGPSLTDLDRVGAWIGGHGGRVVATLPLLSAFVGRGAEPFEPSPYAPVSRRFWGERHLDTDRLPGLPPGWAAPAAGVPAPAPLDPTRPFDHRARAARVRAVLDAALAHLGPGWEADPAYRAFAAATPDLAPYADFRAAVEAHGTGGAGAGRSGDPAAAAVHRYAQWALHVQLDDLAARFAARDQRLYLDLPVGAHPDGFDTWWHRHLFAAGASTGAPPDDFFEHGQDWGFPPLVPGASRAEGHGYLAACLRAQLRAAGVLRLDHVMQLERLYWVPAGFAATDGAYVRYPREELFAVAAIEAHQTGAVVVGEDLGTVPPEIRDGMHDHGLLGLYVLQFEAPAHGHPRPPRADQVASLNTHDTPTFAAWARAADVDLSLDLGLVEAARADRLRADRLAQRHQLRRVLEEGGELAPGGGDADLAQAALAWLGGSEAATVLVSADDLWGGTEPQNVPGTPSDRPNWALRWPRPLEELAADPELGGRLDRLQQARLGAWARTTEVAG